MDRNGAYADIYGLLALRLQEPDVTGWAGICSGKWAIALAGRFESLGLPLRVPESLGHISLSQAADQYQQAFGEPSPALRPVESLFKPWTHDPSATLPLAHEKGWLGGDPATHMRDLFQSLGIAIPAAMAATPDHLCLELEFMALLMEHGSEEQQSLFLKQHLDWVPDLASQSREHNIATCYRDLLDLICDVVRHA